MPTRKTQDNIEPLKTALNVVFSYPELSREEYVLLASQQLTSKGVDDFDTDTVSEAVDKALVTF